MTRRRPGPPLRLPSYFCAMRRHVEDFAQGTEPVERCRIHRRESPLRVLARVFERHPDPKQSTPAPSPPTLEPLVLPNDAARGRRIAVLHDHIFGHCAGRLVPTPTGFGTTRRTRTRSLLRTLISTRLTSTPEDARCGSNRAAAGPTTSRCPAAVPHSGGQRAHAHVIEAPNQSLRRDGRANDGPPR